MKNFSPRIRRENGTIHLARNCSFEDVLSGLNATKGDILYFKREGQKELIESIIKRRMIITSRLEKKWNTEGVAQILYLARDNFNTPSICWYSKEDYPKKYRELTEIIQ